jgi:hypothetical protein
MEWLLRDNAFVELKQAFSKVEEEQDSAERNYLVLRREESAFARDGAGGDVWGRAKRHRGVPEKDWGRRVGSRACAGAVEIAECH